MIEPTKQELSMKALKGANAHLNVLFQEIQNANAAITFAVSRLEEIRKSLGDVHIQAWDYTGQQGLKIQKVSALANDVIDKLQKGIIRG